MTEPVARRRIFAGHQNLLIGFTFFLFFVMFPQSALTILAGASFALAVATFGVLLNRDKLSKNLHERASQIHDLQWALTFFGMAGLLFILIPIVDFVYQAVTSQSPEDFPLVIFGAFLLLFGFYRLFVKVGYSLL